MYKINFKKPGKCCPAAIASGLIYTSTRKPLILYTKQKLLNITTHIVQQYYHNKEMITHHYTRNNYETGHNYT